MAKEKANSKATVLGIKAAKGSMIYTVGNIIGSFAVLLLLIILARLMNPTDFGIYAIAIALYNLLAGHFVFGTVARKDIPQMKDKKKIGSFISNCYIVSLLIGAAVAIAAMLLSSFIATYFYHSAAMTGTLMAASALVFLYVLFNLTLAVLIALDKTKQGTVMYLLYSFIQLLAATALVLEGYGVFGALVGLGIGLIIPSLIGICIIAKEVEYKFSGPSGEEIRHILGFSTPVLVSNVAFFAPPNIAILLLGVYETSLVVGNYNAAFRFGNFVSVILVSISFVLLPSFSKAFSDKDLSLKIGNIYNSSVYYTLLLLLPIVVYVVSVAHPLLYLLFTNKYVMAPFYFVVIALGSVLGIISTYASNLQVGYGDTKKFMYYQVLAVAIQIILLFALTPLLGVEGVLLALFVISQVIIGIIYVYALYRQFHFKHRFGPLIRIIIPSILLLALLYYSTALLHNSKWALVTNLIVILALFPPLVVLFGAVGQREIKFLKDASKSMGMDFIAKYILDYAQFFIRDKK